jgi:hypothetical protein
MAAVHRAGLALLAGDTDATIEHAHRVLELAAPTTTSSVAQPWR